MVCHRPIVGRLSADYIQDVHMRTGAKMAYDYFMRRTTVGRSSADRHQTHFMLPHRQILSADRRLTVGRSSADRKTLHLIMLASHCPEVDTRWSYKYEILNFARMSSRTMTPVNQQQKSLRYLPKVTRSYSNTTRRFWFGLVWFDA